MSKSEDIIKYYAKKYGFHKLLLSLLASTDTQQKEIISKNPIIQNDLFIKYLQNSQLEMKEGLEKIPNLPSDEVSLVIGRFDLVKQNILNSRKTLEKRPAKATSPTTSNFSSQTQCGMCSGVGKITCSSCAGYGYHSSSTTRTSYDGSIEYVDESIPCSSCMGGKQTCWKCGGTGNLFE